MENIFWNKKNVLITGGSGFIGCNLVKELLSLGAHVVVLEHDPEALSLNKVLSPEEKNQLVIIGGDICDFQSITNIFQEQSIAICFHLAAQPLVGAAFESPLETFDVNIKGAINILEASRLSPCLEGLVIASTTHVYGNNKNLPYLESFFPQPTRPYETSKACADLLAQTYFYTYGLPVVMTRLTNTYGPGDLNFSRVVPKTMKSIIEGKNPEIVGGTSVRDYLYVKDAVKGYILLAENLQRKEVQGEAFNFGGGKTYSAIQMAEKALEVSEQEDLKLNVLPDTLLKKEIDTQYVSTEKAHSLLSWEPLHGVEQGLKETYGWYKQNIST